MSDQVKSEQKHSSGERVVTLRAAQDDGVDGAGVPTGGWRCFHCDEVLITRESATEHFGNGDYEDEPPLCVEAATTDLQKLVLTNREMWAQLQTVQSENEELEDHLENFRYVARKLTKKPDATAHDLEHEWDFMEGRMIAAEQLAAVAHSAPERETETQQG